ncbi:uncharacterized protein LOC131026939 [Cryptomeria japonica]|uniref:uncharacterized protein LOC131026939 n=1 Tax=Cryptomeria japonica TaxID=3369 RepID=UPI0027D9D7A9|nr:uncharacterized protein LOC131026939 [Cryptomeria japonica]
MNSLEDSLNCKEIPPVVCASMERGVAAAVANSTALTEEGLVTPNHECALVVDEHHDYLYAVELQKKSGEEVEWTYSKDTCIIYISIPSAGKDIS